MSNLSNNKSFEESLPKSNNKKKKTNLIDAELCKIVSNNVEMPR